MNKKIEEKTIKLPDMNKEYKEVLENLEFMIVLFMQTKNLTIKEVIFKTERNTKKLKLDKKEPIKLSFEEENYKSKKPIINIKFKYTI